MSPLSRPELRVEKITNDGKEHEERGEHVLTFRDPDHGLDMGWMQREQRRYEQRRPSRSGHEIQEHEQEEDIDEMEREIDEVKCGGVVPENAVVNQMGNPGDRMPIVGMNRRETPLDAPEADAVLDRGVFRHVFIVVVLDIPEFADVEIGEHDREKHDDEAGGENRTLPEKHGHFDGIGFRHALLRAFLLFRSHNLPLQRAEIMGPLPVYCIYRDAQLGHIFI